MNISWEVLLKSEKKSKSSHKYLDNLDTTVMYLELINVHTIARYVSGYLLYYEILNVLFGADLNKIGWHWFWLICNVSN